ncbi:MAG: amidohydrolase family protein [Phycisphaerales bacterium]|nr:amidohydrolase family protein [Phycisphaerales bacterium]
MSQPAAPQTVPHKGRQPTPANLLGLDYAAEAERFGPPVVPIIDSHAHINGSMASPVYRRVMEAYGVRRVYSQTQIAQAEVVRRELGDRVRFVAIPEYMSDDRRRAMREGFFENMRRWHSEFGARMLKFWMAPRLRDFLDPVLDADIIDVDSPLRRELAAEAVELGYMFQAHIADPDTWFATKYADASKYGTKASHYEPLERMLEEFHVPWLVAHMGGWPEDLGFLDGLLSRHDNLHLDTSATKWMVRELSKHPREAFVEFIDKWRGRILFGSDIVTLDDHFETSDDDNDRFGAHQASGEAEAFDLYASRYWALRTMWEREYEGPSPIADPDLMMVEPDRFDAMSSPPLRGFMLPQDLLRIVYADAAEALLERWWDEH